jgi:hypothetical protein
MSCHCARLGQLASGLAIVFFRDASRSKPGSVGSAGRLLKGKRDRRIGQSLFGLNTCAHSGTSYRSGGGQTTGRPSISYNRPLRLDFQKGLAAKMMELGSKIVGEQIS